MTSHSENSAPLAARLVRREPHALEELYERYGAAVALLAPTDDLLVETFLRAWLLAPSLAEGTDLAEWLAGVAHEVTGGNDGSVQRSAPVSPRMRFRIMAAAGFEQRRFGFAPFLAGTTLLFLFAAFYFATREKGFAVETAQLRQELRTETIHGTQFRQAMTILEAADVKQTVFSQGKIFTSASRGILLIAAHLQAGKTYQMWVVPENASAVAAGAFEPDANGNAVHVQRGALPPVGMTVQVTVANQLVFRVALAK
ncbi:MAG TPA: hypothetical protein VN736_17120 [Candidatus Limnocylindrales bacterium]|nr:hypothetical protein [Candidatus Limnocylindrales bacterium]